MAETKTIIETAIDEAVESPRTQSMGDLSMTRNTITELIAADKHLARKGASASKTMGVRVGVMRGPGQY